MQLVLGAGWSHRDRGRSKGGGAAHDPTHPTFPSSPLDQPPTQHFSPPFGHHLHTQLYVGPMLVLGDGVLTLVPSSFSTLLPFLPPRPFPLFLPSPPFNLSSATPVGSHCPHHHPNSKVHHQPIACPKAGSFSSLSKEGGNASSKKPKLTFLFLPFPSLPPSSRLPPPPPPRPLFPPPAIIYQFVIDVIHPGRANVSRKELGEKLAAMYKAQSPERVSCFGFRTAFGGGRSTGFALIYDDEASQKKFEPRHRLVRVSSLSCRAFWEGRNETRTKLTVCCSCRVAFPCYSLVLPRRSRRPRGSSGRRGRTGRRRSEELPRPRPET